MHGVKSSPLNSRTAAVGCQDATSEAMLASKSQTASPPYVCTRVEAPAAWARDAK